MGPVKYSFVRFGADSGLFSTQSGVTTMSPAVQKALEPGKIDAVRAQEPSMEEILASIRRIIADDQIGKAAPAEPEEAPEPVAMEEPVATVEPARMIEDDVLDLAEVNPFRPVDETADDDVTFRDFEPEPEPMPEPIRPVFPPADKSATIAVIAGEVTERLLSPTTDASVSLAFNALTSTILTNNARTLEDLVRDMLKPMLKVWLDDNLPTLVERLVRAEIERVARGGRTT